MKLDYARPADTPASSRRGLFRELVLQLALAGVYFLAGKLGLSLAFVHPSASAVWPPTGIALVAVLLLGWRVWPAIFVGAFLVNITTTGSMFTCAGIAVGNTLEALAGAWLVRRFAGGANAFEDAHDIIRFTILAGLLSTMFSATFGVASLIVGGYAALANSSNIWLTWWLGDATSNLLVVPLLLVWIGKPLPRIDVLRAIECVTLLAGVLLVGMVAVGGWFPSGIKNYPLEYLGLLPLLWAAFRFGPRGAATAAMIMSCIAIAGTVRGLGPFARSNPNESLLLLQAFMATATLTALILAAVVLESRRTQAALRRAGEEARAANAAKDRFIAVLSHELRTSLTPVLTTLSTLESDPAILTRWRDELRMIRRNIEHEAMLIDDLLDLSRIARGKLELRLRPVQALDVLEDALRLGHSANGAAPIVVVVRDWTARCTWVQADSARLAQVFGNIVNNAVKFMPKGGTLTARTDNPDQQHLRVQIIDSGIGIPADVLPQLFQPFEQLHGDRTRFGGLGLGLAISRSIVESLGGTLEAHSEGAGRGAAFTVTLPTIAPPVEHPLSTPVPADIAAAVNGSLRILLVEDHRDTARALSQVLARHGHLVLTAHSVADALRLAAQHTFDILISDVGLPDGTGLELMRSLRARYDLRGIALTGYGMEQDIRNTHEAGFSEHLTKPIDTKSLTAAIERLAGSPA